MTKVEPFVFAGLHSRVTFGYGIVALGTACLQQRAMTIRETQHSQ
jgi:hypothetical protein